MIVYHGSVLAVVKPSVQYSKKYLDFGSGFYVTADRGQAESWAKRKAIRLRGKPVVSVYELSDDLSEYHGLVFAEEDAAWLRFVAACRNGEAIFRYYDYVIGSVANDDVFATLDLYRRGVWDTARTLAEIRYYKTSHQICLISQSLIDTELVFSASHEVKSDDRQQS